MFKRILLVASLVASSLFLGSHAAESNVKSIWFSLKGGHGGITGGPIIVISEDGEKWTKIKDTEIFMEGNVRIKTGPGKIAAFGIFWGEHAGLNWPLMYSEQVDGSVKEINRYVMFDYSTGSIPQNSIQGQGLPVPENDGARIIAGCNAALAQGIDIHAGHRFDFEVPVTLGVETWYTEHVQESGSYFPTDFEATKTIRIFIPVSCEAAPPKLHVADPPVPFKVIGAELYLATFKGDGPVPTQGASCKVLKVTARFETTTSGLVHFDLSRKVGDQPLATIPITIEAKKKADGSFAAEYVKDWFLDKPTNAQFFVQETDGQGLSAGWKDINVTCDNNLADPTSQPPLDGPEFKVLKSKFTVTTFQNDSVTGCPVNAALDVEFVTNKPGGVPFKVTGTDGFVWNFSIKAEEALGPLQVGEDQAQFANTYRAKHRRMIQVAKSTDAQYSLEVRNVAAEPGAKTAGPDNLKVRCGGDLSVPLAVTGTELNIVGLSGCPTTAFAAATFVTNGLGDVRYRIAATTGAIETGTAKAKKVGNRFVATAKLPVPITKGGEVIFSATPLDFANKLALKKKQYNCGGPRPGDVTSGTAPETKLDPKKVVLDPPKKVDPPKRIVIDPPKKTVVPVIVTPAPLACSGGVVKNDKCVCRSGFRAVKAAPHVFRCVKTVPASLTLPKAGKEKTSSKKSYKTDLDSRRRVQ